MANVYGVWHGGISYSQSHDWRDNLEWWESIESAKGSIRNRWKCEDDYMTFATIEDDESVTRRSEYIRTPAVDRESCHLDLFDLKSGEPYKRLTLGPRGGVRTENF